MKRKTALLLCLSVVLAAAAVIALYHQLPEHGGQDAFVAQVGSEKLTEQEFRGVLIAEIGLSGENATVDAALFHFARARIATDELKKLGKDDLAKDWRDFLPSMEELTEKDHDLSMRFCQQNGITMEDLAVAVSIIQWKLTSENQIWVQRSTLNDTVAPVDPNELSAELDEKAKRLHTRYNQKKAEAILASLPDKLESTDE